LCIPTLDCILQSHKLVIASTSENQGTSTLSFHEGKHRFHQHVASPTWTMASSDGRVVTVGGNIIQMWFDGQLLSQRTGDESLGRAVATAKDLVFTSAGLDLAAVHDATKLERISTLGAGQGHAICGRWNRSISTASSDRLIITGRQAAFVDMATGQVVCQLALGREGSMMAETSSCAASMVAIAVDLGPATVFDLRTKTEVFRCRRNRRCVSGLSFDRDGSHLAVADSYNSRICSIYDVRKTAQCLHRLSDCTATPAFSSHGRLAVPKSSVIDIISLSDGSSFGQLIAKDANNIALWV